MINRPGVAGAVLQTALSSIRVSDDLLKYIQSNITPKLLELES